MDNKKNNLRKRFESCHEKYHMKKNLRETNELMKEYKKKHEEYHKISRELFDMHRSLKKHGVEHERFRSFFGVHVPLFLIINIVVWYTVFKYGGSEALFIIFAIMFSIAWVVELFFHWRLEKRVMIPLTKLKEGVEEIAKGNYEVMVENERSNKISIVIDSFNDMAKKLLESERIKNEYEENRKNLIANISHDLKTPITSIQGYIEAILEGNVSAEGMNKYLKTIYNNSAYINKLIDDLFLFSKLDMQKLEFEFVEIKVKPFIGDLMEEFMLEFEEENIKFTYEDNLERDHEVKVDRKRLYQVFRNIIGNAVKHGVEDDLKIEASLYRKDDWVCISIEDNGIGIPADKLPHIFDRFYRVDTQRTKDLNSTGLGLAIARELVEAHGGKIEVWSSEGVGTSFLIMLPISSNMVA